MCEIPPAAVSRRLKYVACLRLNNVYLQIIDKKISRFSRPLEFSGGGVRACIDHRLDRNVCLRGFSVGLAPGFRALVHPLSIAMLIPTGFLAAISALGIRTLWRHSPDRRASSRGDLIMDILLGASLPIFAAALSLPGTNAWGLGLFLAINRCL